MNVLLVEDDRCLAAAFAAGLRRYGYAVVHASTGREAGQATGYDLVLLDLDLADEDGLALCRSIRRFCGVPLILLSSRGAEQDRVLGLRAGADDYLVKPFGMAALEARIQAVVCRPRAAANATIVVDDLTLDLAARTVRRAGRAIGLTPKEFGLLARIAERRGKVVQREQLLLEIWHDTGRAAARTLDVHITHLRAKLGRPAILQTVRGVGYRLGTAGGG
ncbi:DNA-binding response regulator [Sphaerisporangium krabiense]|uniref:DNA-binding response OmpR family regulator n=1 Tax=Sphaerisporangium krabiense TaxID=763782 RepID=A0A7W8ZAG7_9ACTN|nr:response regulator transcription factor [Sphaerisporangium krabiense]MBB5630409.1 DNA-binding response OmpR family regulator [Sphaerisporangium krabiense]GII62638.1 DNA-binding response regulator [Sphaerisporangium krabiense]